MVSGECLLLKAEEGLVQHAGDIATSVTPTWSDLFYV